MKEFQEIAEKWGQVARERDAKIKELVNPEDISQRDMVRMLRADVNVLAMMLGEILVVLAKKEEEGDE